MKPQCETSAQCLKELARVMEQFGFEYHVIALQSVYVREQGRAWSDLFPAFTKPEDWQFAIAEVEGKPVFIGDELYEKARLERVKLIVISYLNGTIVCKSSKEACDIRFMQDELSWNPPKPAHIMVKLPWFVIEQYASCNGSYAPYREEIQQACKLALEKLK